MQFHWFLYLTINSPDVSYRRMVSKRGSTAKSIHIVDTGRWLWRKRMFQLFHTGKRDSI